MGTSDDGSTTRGFEELDGTESEKLREAYEHEIRFRVAYMKALDLLARAMYQNQWKGWSK